MTTDSVALLFAIVALSVSVVTGKRLALASSLFFFISAFLPNVSGYEATVISMIMLNLAMFTVAAIEYKVAHSKLSRWMMWLFVLFIGVSASYAFWTTDAQGHALLALSVIELILLSSLDGCRNVWIDIKHTFDSVLHSSGGIQSSDGGRD